MDWTLKSYAVSAGIHTLKWVYEKDGSDEDGDDCGWVDFVQWTGPSPAQDPSNWQEIAYKHDVLGRRVEKKVDGYSTRYVYDGGHVIAEYDGNNNLLRKYVYGPGVDQPVCMIEVADANATYYYHYDALGSVVALSDANGDTVQTYEYSVYGEVAVEDANHPNPYMFAGRRFDIEIGLYYNRARYYNPYTGRFLQTDPIGYGDGMNWYAYCSNNPLNSSDPSGLRDIKVDIPMESVPQYDEGGTGQELIKSYLRDVGFYEEYKDWTVTGVSIVNGNFVVTLHIDDDKWKGDDPNFGIAEVAGLRVCTIDGIGRLDSMDWMLNQIITLGIHEMNQQWRPLTWAMLPTDLTPDRVADLIIKLFGRQTAFAGGGIPQTWYYKGEKYDKSEVNYIIMGHGMHHQKVARYLGLWLAVLWKGVARGVAFPKGAIYWFTKGYNEYDARAGW